MTMTGETAGPLKIALIGCGKMGLNHIRAIQACSAGRLVAVADPVNDRSKAAPVLKGPDADNVQWFTSAEEMLKTAAPDVVHIVTPPGTHAALAKLCLSHNANVYVEKPFTLTTPEAEDVLQAAERANLKVCAGHQLLFEKVAGALQNDLPLLGQIVHVESYFSFRTVRKSRDGRSLASPVEQLLDILPHPVYTMLDVLRRSEPEAPVELTSFEVRAEGEVHALLRAGRTTAMLVVTLRGRPIESYLRVIGTNGFLRADFVRGALTRLPGAGANAIAILSNPYREAKQIAVGSTKGFASRILGKKKGYPGLTELANAFYESIRDRRPAPLTPDSIRDTVRICEQIGTSLLAADAARERQAETELAERARNLPPIAPSNGGVLVTGGGGLLGRAVVRELRSQGWSVRSGSRNVPRPSSREAGVDYVTMDLGGPLDQRLFTGISTVIHCAAETAGDKAAHERNTVHATRNLLQAAAAAGVKNFLHVSSIAVLKPGNGSRVLDESSPVDTGNLGRGPYVWAKAEAEKDVLALAPQLGINLRIVRPGPLVDFANYEPPGRLGRELGPVFMAIGPKRGGLSLCDISTAAQVMRAIVANFEASPALVNLIEPKAPTRDELMKLWLARRPDLGVFWMPSWLLAILSPMAVLAQKVLRPRAAAISLAAAFASEKYDGTLAGQLIDRAQHESATARRASAAPARTPEPNLV